MPTFLGTFSMDRPSKSADLPEMNSLVKSFTYWYEAKSETPLYILTPTAFTEGCNNKIKVLKRVSHLVCAILSAFVIGSCTLTHATKKDTLYSVHVLSRRQIDTLAPQNLTKNLFFQCKLIRSNHSSVLYFLLLVMFLVYDHIPALSNKAGIFN